MTDSIFINSSNHNSEGFEKLKSSNLNQIKVPTIEKRKRINKPKVPNKFCNQISTALPKEPPTGKAPRPNKNSIKTADNSFPVLSITH